MGLRLCVCVWILNYKKSDSINKRGESALDTVELSAPVDGAGQQRREDMGLFPVATVLFVTSNLTFWNSHWNTYWALFFWLT